MSDKTFEEVKAISDAMVTDGTDLEEMRSQMEQMYFMEDGTSKPATTSRDPNDLKLTISTGPRDEVTGMVRLLATSEPQFKAKSKLRPAKLDVIEELCDRVWKESSKVKVGKVMVDGARSAVLYGEAQFGVDKVSDLLEVIDEEEKPRMEDVQKRTPFLVSSINPRYTRQKWGAWGPRGWLVRMQVRGDEIKSRWQLPDGMVLDDVTMYWLRDYTDLTYRAVWIEEQSTTAILFEKHGLKFIPYVLKMSDGSDLWKDETRKRNPFLYGMWKGGWWKRQNLLYTTIFTSMAERGTGLLVGFDEPPDKVEVNFAGPVRWISAGKNPKLLNADAFDPSLLQVKNQILDPVEAGTTIYKQTLGENVNGSTFGGLSLLSQSGRLPLQSPEETLSEACKEATIVMLKWWKQEGGALPDGFDLTVDDIPDDLELEVTMKAKMPQDTFRNAQIAETLSDKGLVSEEWIRTEVLQIGDSKAMTKRIWFEQAAKAMYQSLLQPFLQRMGQGYQAQPADQATTDQAQPMDQAAADQAMQARGAVGGSQAAAAGGEQLPPTEPNQPDLTAQMKGELNGNQQQ